MKTVLTITDVTRMQGNRVCIAGYTRDGRCVRPLFKFSHITEGWLYDGNEAVLVQPFALVEFDLQQAIPESPHSEDWLVGPGVRVRKGMLTDAQQQALSEKIEDASVAAIFGAPVHHDVGYYVRAGEGNRSLGTVAIQDLDVHFTQRSPENWDHRLTFTDRTGQQYRLKVVDLAFRYYLDYCRAVEGMRPVEAAGRLAENLRSGAVYLRIGLARGWDEHPDRCYLQLTGVYSFPDYLAGRSFADFKPVRNSMGYG